MIPEVVLAAEGLPTDVTRVGPLVCVGPLVDQQVVRLGEVTPTETTNVLLFWSRKKKMQILICYVLVTSTTTLISVPRMVGCGVKNIIALL